MNRVVAVIVALLVVCATAQTSEGQRARRPLSRDSVLMLPRVTIQALPDVYGPNAARLQQRRHVLRDSLLGELAAARDRWRQHQTDRITYRLTELCFCSMTGGLPVYATVMALGDSVLTVVDQRGEPTTVLYPSKGQPSISFLFERAEAAIRGQAEDVIVTFDSASGIPTRIFEDGRVGVTDDELDILVSHIELRS